MTEMLNLDQEISYVRRKIMEDLPTFYEKVPGACSVDYVYPAEENNDWTDAFWIGMLHMLQHVEYNAEIAKTVDRQLEVFQNRVDTEFKVEHHDMGFLYSLAAIADYKENHRESSKQMAIQAADILMRRYLPVAGIIQAWGDMNNPEQQGRMIVDCNMNLPLLYFASEITGDQSYYDAAYQHIKNAQKYIVRPDDSTYHTYYMDVNTGEPKYGNTAQGFSDDSCWSRGQAWAIYGFCLNYLHTGDASLLETACKTADYFLARLPEDKVCYWDLIFTEGDEERDTSAAAIAASGLLEIVKALPKEDERAEKYHQAAVEIITSLAHNYTTKDMPYSNAILTEAVYSKPGNSGVNEACIWGDYYYLESLMKLNHSMILYW